MAQALDGTPQTTSTGTTSFTATLTTSLGTDVWIVDTRLFTGGNPTAAVTSAHLTWLPVPGTTNAGIGPGPHIIWQFYAPATSALTSEVVTVTFTGGSPIAGDMILYAVSGSNTSSSFDGNAGTTTSGTAPAITTTNANDFLVGSLVDSGATATAGAGWTITASSSNLFSENQVVSATGTYSATITGDTILVGLVSAIKAAGGGGGGSPPLGIIGLASAEW